MTRFCVLSCIAAILLVPCGLHGQQSPQLPALKQEAVVEVDKLQTFTQQMVDEIFSFSELGFLEYETSRYVTGILEKNGFHVEHGVAGVPTAWVATYGSGKPVIAFITDIDCIPRASQKPGVAYHDPIVEGAPGHGEGHNSGMAVNVTAALVLKKLMDEYHLAGTIKLVPGVAEELLGTKAFYVRAGLFKDVDIVLGAHVESEFSTSYGTGNGEWSGLVSVQYFFHGKAAHAAAAPWEGRSALDAVELMDTGWDFRREHLRPAQRSHRVIINGGDQPNVVPSEAAVWYYFRELDYPHIKDLYDLGFRDENDRDYRRSQVGRIRMAAVFEQGHRRDSAEKYRSRRDAEMERRGSNIGEGSSKGHRRESGRPQGKSRAALGASEKTYRWRIRRHRRYLLERADGVPDVSGKHSESAGA